MAGKRQHYVPQLLQRGFLDKSSDKAKRTWLHRRDTNARLVGIRDIGVEDWFYSRKSPDGTPTLDDVITDIESDLGSFVESLREAVPGTPIDAMEASRTVVHLVMRTAHLRRVISMGMADIANEVEAMLTDPERLRGLIGYTGSAPASFVSDSIRESAAELVSAGIPAAFSERVMAFVMRELGEELVRHMVMTLKPIFPQLFSDLADKVRDAHNSILATTPESNGWVNALAAFEWTIEEVVDLILPDSVALAYEDGRSLMPLLFTKAADVRAVVMPVSSNRMLLGRAPNSALIDFGAFNIQAAENCESFFIAAKPFHENELNSLIGSAPFNAIKETVAEAIFEAEQVRSSIGAVSAVTEPLTFTEQDFSFSVRLYDFGDGFTAKEYADVLRGVVGTLSNRFPLHDLDGFTIAIDYVNALQTLDRGDPDLPVATSREISYGQGVAKSVKVVRDGISKQHVVIAASLAEMWLSPDTTVRTTGIYMLVNVLAGIAHSTRYAKAWEVSFTPEIMGRALHLAVASTPAGYWSAREAAYVDPDQGQAYAELVIGSLNSAERVVAEERLLIAESGDISQTTRRAHECVTAILGHAADWLGHRDGLVEDQAFAGSDLPERLKTRGLERWIELFGRNLTACYSSEGVLDLAVVSGLSQHVERLLWHLGIYCWPEDDDILCVVTERHFVLPELHWQDEAETFR